MQQGVEAVIDAALTPQDDTIFCNVSFTRSSRRASIVSERACWMRAEIMAASRLFARSNREIAPVRKKTSGCCPPRRRVARQPATLRPPHHSPSRAEQYAPRRHAPRPGGDRSALSPLAGTSRVTAGRRAAAGSPHRRPYARHRAGRHARCRNSPPTRRSRSAVVARPPSSGTAAARKWRESSSARVAVPPRGVIGDRDERHSRRAAEIVPRHPQPHPHEHSARARIARAARSVSSPTALFRAGKRGAKLRSGEGAQASSVGIAVRTPPAKFEYNGGGESEPSAAQAVYEFLSGGA